MAEVPQWFIQMMVKDWKMCLIKAFHVPAKKREEMVKLVGKVCMYYERLMVVIIFS